MNHHQRLLPPGGNRALRSLSLLLLALISQREMQAMPRFRQPKTNVAPPLPRGYLAAIGAPALRFEEPAPAPTERPLSPSIVSAPTPIPPAISQETEKAAPVSVPTPSQIEDSGIAEAKGEQKPALKNKPSPAIIPDDTRPQVRAEDFLPFFQFPATGSNGTMNVIVPVPREPASPAALPTSSATYTQTPK